MASSLLGADFDGLSVEAQALVDSVMGDTVGGELTEVDVGDAGTLLVGTGADGVTQGVIFPSGTGAAITGEVTAGALQVSIALPANLTVAFEALPASASPEEGESYLLALIEEAYGSGGDAAGKQALINAVTAVFSTLGVDATSVKVSVVFLSSGNTAPAVTSDTDVVFTGTGDSSEVLAFVMDQLSPGKTLVLEGIASSVIVGNGTVQLAGFASAVVAGNLGNQDITGSTGNDTLVGGGGNDTLAGGEGADVFGINVASGSLVLRDFSLSEDKLAFDFADINSWNDLLPYFTGLEVEGNDTTANFGDYYSITFVGVAPEELTTSFLQFNLG